MSQLVEIRQKRAAVFADMKALINKAANEKRGLTSDENAQYERMSEEFRGFQHLSEEIESNEAIERSLDESRENHERANHAAGNNGAQKVSHDEAFSAWVRSQDGHVNAETREVLRANLSDVQKRDLATSASNVGGATIPEGFRAVLVEAQKFVGGIRTTRATVFSTSSGNQLLMPTDNDATTEGVQLAEATAATVDSSTPFGQTSFGAYKYSSKTMKVSIELLQDSALNVPAIVVGMLAKRMFRIQNRHFTIGNGTTQPQGIVSAAATVTAASATAVVYTDLLNLEFGVDAAYRNNSAEWMCHDLFWKEVLKLDDSTGRPLVNGVNVGISAGEPDTLRGRPVRFNQHMSSAMTTGQLVLAFGDFSSYNVRDSLGTTLIRFNELYMESQQVGFSMIARTDGRYVNAGTDPVKVLKLA